MTSPLVGTSPLPSTASQPTANKPTVKVVPFIFDRPVKTGAITITGTGPADVPIVLLDVNYAGEQWAAGRIGSDGKFRLTLTRPAEVNRRLGLMLGVLAGAPFTAEAYHDAGFYGPGARSVPNYAFFYDTVTVTD